MSCKYSREASEMYCILSNYCLIDLCWNIDEKMKKCKYFHEITKDEWIKLSEISDADFIKKENIPTSINMK